MDVAGAVVFLCSPAASMITGHTVLIDGGWTAR
jgi:NAD(P)-dependent dehydrogenase (short-subunit alcohol dehydrogenase family)